MMTHPYVFLDSLHALVLHVHGCAALGQRTTRVLTLRLQLKHLAGQTQQQQREGGQPVSQGRQQQKQQQQQQRARAQGGSRAGCGCKVANKSSL